MNARAKGNWQGMNWIRQTKRLAIYLRDGLACAWCGAPIEKCVVLTLDHLTPHSKGGSNNERNLVTCCKHCNDSRGARSKKVFATVVASYVNKGVKPEAILKHIADTTRKPLGIYLEQAKRLINERGTAFAALNQKGKK